jgi:hypothetical protein
MTDLSKMTLAQADAFAVGWFLHYCFVNGIELGFMPREQHCTLRVKGWKARQKAARRKSL